MGYRPSADDIVGFVRKMHLEGRMDFSKKLGAIAFLTALTFLGGGREAAAQAQQTVESAHQFIRQMLPDGASSVEGFDSAGNYTEQVTITSVISSGCQTEIYARVTGKGSIHKTIDWSKVSSVYYYRGIQIQGPIRTRNGSIMPNMSISTAGENTGDRLATAMNFLREKCDTARSTGF